MASTILVDKIDPQSGTALEIGSSGDTISFPTGTTLSVAGSTSGLPDNTPSFLQVTQEQIKTYQMLQIQK